MRQIGYHVLSMLFAVLSAIVPVQAWAGSDMCASDVNDTNEVTASNPPERMVSNSHVPTVITVDNKKGVGEIPFTSGVSQTGALTYQIPIEACPGVNGLQPAVSLAYNSQRGDGLLGVGWYLSGVSAISRGGKSIYYDSTTDGVRMDLTDSFWLDGTRLIKIKKESDHILYQSEQGNIMAKGYYSGNAMGHFEVFYPDGLKGVFGNASSQTNKIEYPLTSLVDLHGNRVEYRYSTTENVNYLTTIQYNGGAQIRFIYQTRTSPLLYYRGGVRSRAVQMLSAISVSLNSKEIRKYSIVYQDSPFGRLLSEVSLSSGGQTLNPIRVYYGLGKTEGTFGCDSITLGEGHAIESQYAVSVTRGKFDYAEGEDGIISMHNFNPYWETNHISRNTGKKVQFFQNSTPTGDKIWVYPGLTGKRSYMKTEKGFIDVLCANLSGSQEENIVRINNNISDGKDVITFSVYKAGNEKGLTLLYTRTFSFPTLITDETGNRSVHPKFYYAGDFNGDGKSEILAVSVNNPFDTQMRSSTYVFDLEGNKILFEGGALRLNMTFTGEKITDAKIADDTSDKLFPIDYDGDGKTDLCLVNESGTAFYTFDVNGGLMSLRCAGNNPAFSRANVKRRCPLIGDCNGDGLADIVLSPVEQTGSTEWTMLLSKGDGLLEKSVFTGPKYAGDKKSGFIMHDVNGDGRGDIIFHDESSFSVYLASGTSFSAKPMVMQLPKGNTILAPTDINSTNCFTSLVGLRSKSLVRYSYDAHALSEKNSTGIAGSFGKIERTEYSLVNKNGVTAGIFTRGDAAEYPYVSILEPLPVVTAREVYAGGKLLDSRGFTYKDGCIHRQGLGFLGFGNIVESNIRNQKTTTEYDTRNFGIVKRIVSPVQEKTFDYSVTVKDDRRASILMRESRSKDLLTGVSSTTTVTYDSYGYPLSESTVYSDGQSLKRNYSYESSPTVSDGYYLGFRTESMTLTLRNGDSYSKIERIMSHAKRKPTSYREFENGVVSKTVGYVYDGKGNKLRETVRNYTSADSLVTSYAYDSYGRIVRETAPNGCVVKYTYDTNGRISSSRDARGNDTYYSYDFLGRRVSSRHPDGTVDSLAYVWSASVPGALYAKRSMSTGQPLTVVYNDAAGREVRRSDVRFNGVSRNVDTQYDRYGNKTKESFPFTGASATLWKSYAYDEYNRIILESESSGKKTTYAYDGASVTTTENGISVRREYDAVGNMISATDPAGSVRYVLGGKGKPLTVTAPGNIVTKFKYDPAYRLIGVTDPSKGMTKYSYDSAGNLSSETDADGKRISYVYDKFGKIIKKTCPEFTTTYTYNGYDELTKVATDNSTSTEYGYDDYGRNVLVKERAPDAVSFSRRYAYENGNVSKITYVGYFGKTVTESRKHSNGHLSEIILNDTVSVFRLSAENALGLPSKSVTGPLTRTYTYSAYGLPQRRKATVGQSVIQDFLYSFNHSTGNLASRTDNTRGKRESFTYDGMNRLTSYGGNTVSYDAKGNITSRTGIGAYSYSLTSKPYALTGLASTGTSIPVTTQEISYTSFSRPSEILEDTRSTGFIYNGEYDRVRMEVKSKNNTLTSANTSYCYYLGGCYQVTTSLSAFDLGPVVKPAAEIVQQANIQSEHFFIGGDYYDAPAVYVKRGNIGTVYYILRDYLGSITHIVKGDGTLRQELSYDAWGSLRDPATHEVYATGKHPTLFLWRGYTGHEHLNSYGLINMNARLYDPAVGRFLSPDPLVQMPDMTQNFNRYSYCLNNPLSYVDENGEFFWAAVGVAAFIGAVTNVGIHWQDIVGTGGWKGVWKGLGYFAAGGIAGGAGAAAGMLSVVGIGGISTITATTFSGVLAGGQLGGVTGLVNGFLLNTSNALIGGDSFGAALTKGVYGAATEGFFGGILGGLAGGIQAAANKQNFWTGASGSATKEVQLSVPETVETLTAKEIEQTKGESTFLGYFGFDNDGSVRYVGTTTRDLALRSKEHLRSGTERSFLHFKAIQTFENKLDMRIWEQMNINKYGMIKNGGVLFNKRNEIAPKFWEMYNIK